MACRIAWDQAPVTMTANEALAANNNKGSAGREAQDFLREYLADGPQPSDQVEAAAQANGISEPTLRRARKALKIVAEKTEFTGGWSLRLP
jgi:putative DNA primase/helicase